MITINLSPGLKRKRARQPLAGRRWTACAAWAAGEGSRCSWPSSLGGRAGWLGFGLVGTTRELSALTPQLEQSRAENTRFKAFIQRRGSRS